MFKSFLRKKDHAVAGAALQSGDKRMQTRESYSTFRPIDAYLKEYEEIVKPSFFGEVIFENVNNSNIIGISRDSYIKAADAEVTVRDRDRYEIKRLLDSALKFVGGFRDLSKELVLTTAFFCTCLDSVVFQDNGFIASVKDSSGTDLFVHMFLSDGQFFFEKKFLNEEHGRIEKRQYGSHKEAENTVIVVDLYKGTSFDGLSIDFINKTSNKQFEIKAEEHHNKYVFSKNNAVIRSVEDKTVVNKRRDESGALCDTFETDDAFMASPFTNYKERIETIRVSDDKALTHTVHENLNKVYEKRSTRDAYNYDCYHICNCTKPESGTLSVYGYNGLITKEQHDDILNGFYDPNTALKEHNCSPRNIIEYN